MRSPTVNVALERWAGFLDLHQPGPEGYEDGFAERHVRSARLELMRLHYLHANTEAGDALLRQVVREQ
jgi:hypothetical protein